MGIAYEHGKILKKLMREMIDPQLATRLSGMFVNQRTLIEYENAEKRIAELEALIEKLSQGKVTPAEGCRWPVTSQSGSTGLRG